MKFDRSKVVDGLCDNLEQWIGWKGFFSDYLEDLKGNVENETGLRTMKWATNSVCPFETKEDEMFYQFFYPVEKPEKKPVPFNNCEELVGWFCAKYGIARAVHEMPAIWVKSKYTKSVYLVSGFLSSQSVSIDGSGCDLARLSSDFNLVDGTPIGKEVEK